MLGVTHMQRANLYLVVNSSVWFIFLFVLNVFDSSPYGNFNIFNTFFYFLHVDDSLRHTARVNAVDWVTHMRNVNASHMLRVGAVDDGD